MTIKAFRLFVSSTFADFRQEREVLQQRVFPDVAEYCRGRGYQFSPIDLRWGVSGEAQLDQKTVEICLKQVETSKLYPPPNFLIMLGNRYGWVPLPYAIARDDFKVLCEQISKHGPTNADEIIKNLRKLYVLDENHLAQSASGEMTSAHILIHRHGELADQEKWQHIENFYLPHLQNAAERLFAAGRISARARDKYFISLTEQEIHHGASGSDADQLFVLIRDMDNPQDAPDYYIENNKGNAVRLADLRERFRSGYVLKTSTKIENRQPSQSYLDEFASRIENHLLAQIDAHIERVQSMEKAPDHELQAERGEHRAFRDEKLKIFVGRRNSLQLIAKYLVGGASHPLMIYGRSGQGKSALMAAAIQQAEEHDAPLIYRFIGTSAQSGNLRSVLISLMDDLAAHEIMQIPQEWEQDENKFLAQIRELLGAIDQPASLFFDALDQLRGAVRTDWLPGELPSGLKIVISTLDDEDYQRDSAWFERLKSQYPPSAFMEIRPLGEQDGREILESLLDEAKRRLQEPQFAYVLEKFRKADGSPLYLRTAFEIIRHWKSSDLPGEKHALADGVSGIIRQFIADLTSLYHHEHELVQKVLAYLAAAKDGLSEPELMDVLSRDKAVMDAAANDEHVERSKRLPASVWVRLHGQLEPFLSSRKIDDALLMQFFHRQMAQVAGELCHKEHHAALTDYFESLNRQEPIRTNGQFGERTRYNIRALSELLFQLYESDQTERMNEILLGPAFMEDRLAAHGVPELLADYRDFAQEMDPDSNRTAQALLGRTLSLSAGQLMRDQLQLFPHLLGRLQTDMGPEIEGVRKQVMKLVRTPSLIPRRPRFISADSLLIRTMEGHGDNVLSVAFSPDGQHIVSSSYDKTLRLWEALFGFDVGLPISH